MTKVTSTRKAVEDIYVEALSEVSIDFSQPMAPQIYAAVRRIIVHNRLAPGTPIYEARFAEILGVSRTPLRLALHQLAKEGLVETRPQVGSIVAPIDRQRILAAVFCRSALETAVVRRLASLPSLDINALEALLDRQREFSARGDYEGFFEADEKFHALLARSAGVPEAWELVLSSKTHVDRARLRLQSTIPGRSALAYKEHLAIIEAIRAQDADLAADRMDSHIRSALDIV